MTITGTTTGTTIGDHAVVLGAGLSGLLAAAALTAAYRTVTVVERDATPTDPAARRGVPQGRHAHTLMPRGTRAVEELLPGSTRALLGAGAVASRPLADYRLVVGGHALRQVPTTLTAVQATRPFLEHHVRAGVLADDRVELRPGRDAVGLVTDRWDERVTGVRVIRRAAGSAEETLPADLVVDATGRSGRTPAWLAAMGRPRPPEESLAVDVGYATRVVRMPGGHAASGVENLVGVGAVPGRPRGLMTIAVEDGLRMVTLAGYTRAHHPPTDPAGFDAWLATVAPPDVLAALRAAEPVGDIAAFRYPGYVRRRYDRLLRPLRSRFPAGLVVVGDALCSLSPVYAQGMTIAALEALALREELAAGPDGLARRFFRRAARLVADPWRAATGADLALPEVPGPRPLAIRVANAYSERVLAAATGDDVVAAAFLRVFAMVDPATALLRPAVARRVLWPRPTDVTSPASRLEAPVGG